MKTQLTALCLLVAFALQAQNVGIGTTTPTKAKLVVRGVIGATNTIFGDNTTGIAIENNYPGIGLNSYYNAGRKYIAYGYAGLIGLNPDNGDMYMQSSSAFGAADANAGITMRMVINRFGDIGIEGNTDPQSPLSFANLTGDKINFFNSGANSLYGIGIQGALMQLYTNDASADIALGYGSSSTFNENIRFKGNGNMSVGGPVWTSAANDRVISFGDGDYVHIGEVGNDDRMELKASRFLFKGGNVQIQDGSQGAGKALVSDVNGVGTWTAQSFTNQDRFKVTFSTLSGIDFDFSSTKYNLSANIVIDLAANTITFNKAGLYHFNLYDWIWGVSFVSEFILRMSINGSTTANDIYYGRPLDANPPAAYYTHSFNFGFDQYIAAGSVIKITSSVTNWGGMGLGYFSGYLISE